MQIPYFISGYMKRSLFGTSSAYVKKKSAAPKLRYFANPWIEAETNNAESLQISEDTLKTMLEDIEEKIKSQVTPSSVEDAPIGLYLGTAGIAYMFYYLSKIARLSSKHDDFKKRALEYIEPALVVAHTLSCRKADRPGFILGIAGVYAVATAIYNTVSDVKKKKKYKDLYKQIESICETNFLETGSDEYFEGRAGKNSFSFFVTILTVEKTYFPPHIYDAVNTYLKLINLICLGYILGALWLARETNTPVYTEKLIEICQIMVASGREYSKLRDGPCPLMYSYYGVEYFGAAHGLCTILLSLISIPNFMKSDAEIEEDIKATVDYLLSLQDDEGNFPAASDETKQTSHILVHWCHGAPGLIYLMAKAYLIWGEEQYLKSCEKSAELIWQKGLLRKGSGICHGVAGNGYTFLLMYRLTKNEKYLKRAQAFAQFLEYPQFKEEARTPDYPHSLYEGIAGTACFLADLMNPSEAAFPFLDIFFDSYEVQDKEIIEEVKKIEKEKQIIFEKRTYYTRQSPNYN